MQLVLFVSSYAQLNFHKGVYVQRGGDHGVESGQAEVMKTKL